MKPRPQIGVCGAKNVLCFPPPNPKKRGDPKNRLPAAENTQLFLPLKGEEGKNAPKTPPKIEKKGPLNLGEKIEPTPRDFENLKTPHLKEI